LRVNIGNLGNKRAGAFFQLLKITTSEFLRRGGGDFGKNTREGADS
jgi:hypothetical protein